MTDLQLGQNPGNEGVIYDLKARLVFAPLLKEIKKPTHKIMFLKMFTNSHNIFSDRKKAGNGILFQKLF